MTDPVKTRIWAQQCLAEFDAADSGLMKAALALAVLQDSRIDLETATGQVNRLVAAASAAFVADLPATLGDAVVLLNHVMLDAQGFGGDHETPEDPSNACMGRLLRRRRGLSAGLGIVYVHTARAVGLEAAAINFPDHVFIRLSQGKESVIVDPYHGGMQHGAAGLRALLKALAGPDRELGREDYRPIDDRALLMRLQMERKYLHMKASDSAGAARAIGGLLAIDAGEAELLWEQGVLLLHSGDTAGGQDSLRRYLAREGELGNRARAAELLQSLTLQSA